MLSGSVTEVGPPVQRLVVISNGIRSQKYAETDRRLPELVQKQFIQMALAAKAVAAMAVTARPSTVLLVKTHRSKKLGPAHQRQRTVRQRGKSAVKAGHRCRTLVQMA